MQLSRAGEFYPGVFCLPVSTPTSCPSSPALCGSAHIKPFATTGTSERVLLLSGTLHSVLTSVFLMLEKLPKEPAMAMGRAAAKPREDAVSCQVVDYSSCHMSSAVVTCSILLQQQKIAHCDTKCLLVGWVRLPSVVVVC